MNGSYFENPDCLIAVEDAAPAMTQFPAPPINYSSAGYALTGTTITFSAEDTQE